MRQVLVVLGTRPEAIKLAPVAQALERSTLFDPVLVVTAQHRRLLDQVLALFGVDAAHDLAIMREGQSLAEITTRALSGLMPLIAQHDPDLVLVQGDTTSTFAGALAAFYARVPVCHLEAGLRSGDRWSPYPEELNRRLTSQLASLHLAPTVTAKRALIAEGIGHERITVTGNTVIDALQWVAGREGGYADPALQRLGDDPRRLMLVTAHRRESWGAGLQAVGNALAELASRRSDLLIVFPIHPNPTVRAAISPAVAGLDNVWLLEPLDYGDFAKLMARADIVLTDSGGVQEEAPSLGKPVLVMREVTERPEAVTLGNARLLGTATDAIVGSVEQLLSDDAAYARMATAASPYGDGQAAGRALAALAHFFGLGPKPADYEPERGGA